MFATEKILKRRRCDTYHRQYCCEYESKRKPVSASRASFHHFYSAHHTE